MSGFRMKKNLNYTGMALNRVADQRREEAWIKKHLSQKDTVVIPIWRSLNLVRVKKLSPQTPECIFPTGKQAQSIISKADIIVFLGLYQEIAYFAVDISAMDNYAIKLEFGADLFEDLRKIGTFISKRHGALMAYARAMIHWHQRHIFCGVCGKPTKSRNGGHMLICQNKQEAHMHFPRTDPAVIMLVTHNNPEGNGPACLLGRQKKWADGMYSTLAGFVEPGETLEEAVAREVFEEAAIDITDIFYQTSQPWPFPASLMLGFRAKAVSTIIKVDKRELEDAKWFTIDELKSFGEKGDALIKKNQLPGRDTISRYLIDEWLSDMSND